MEALLASYGDSYSDSDTERGNPSNSGINSSSSQPETTNLPLPPPPLSLVNPPNSLGKYNISSINGSLSILIYAHQLFAVLPTKGSIDHHLPTGQPSRVRNFPHVEGNYALHVYIPVLIPLAPKKELAQFLKRVSSILPGIYVVDVDVPFTSLRKDDSELEQVAFGREFHISLGRTVPIRVHQIDSIVAMLRQRLQSQRRYWIDFSKWEVFVNDDRSRTFLSLEVTTGGLLEITKQIQVVNEVYRLHNLPEFYKDPRPHISLAWLLGDVSSSLKRVVVEEMKRLSVESSLHKHFFSCKFGGIHCKIGKKTYKICKFSGE
ncbi:U6 snRNA phosphodiesterase [Citrus sinensis]|uniref:U6 snRNA phosphodiesterase n=1 Tax=Citrus sinensis TaxID=2711 RepID=A0ACB8LBD7_CITSI|nr:U6 snRNA phosphodiesterase [Citrus sinensis]